MCARRTGSHFLPLFRSCLHLATYEEAKSVLNDVVKEVSALFIKRSAKVIVFNVT